MSLQTRPPRPRIQFHTEGCSCAGYINPDGTKEYIKMCYMHKFIKWIKGE